MKRAFRPHRRNVKPASAVGAIVIRTRDGFEVGHSDAGYPDWRRTGSRDDIVAWRSASA